jgi:hypothetical protein
MMVLLPKPDGSSRGIGLLEVLWKILTSIIGGGLKAAISFHDALHGFRPGLGMMTAIIEAKAFPAAHLDPAGAHLRDLH